VLCAARTGNWNGPVVASAVAAGLDLADEPGCACRDVANRRSEEFELAPEAL
jgi:hypothetical protein